MAKGWLTRTGHPVLTYNTSYDAAKKQVTVSFQQTGFEKHEDKDPWVFPVDWALVKNGRNVKEGIFIMDQDKAFFAHSCTITLAHQWRPFYMHSSLCKGQQWIDRR